MANRKLRTQLQTTIYKTYTHKAKDRVKDKQIKGIPTVQLNTNNDKHTLFKQTASETLKTKSEQHEIEIR